jgi:hypothetical protein
VVGASDAGMITWMLLFVAAVVMAYFAIAILLHPIAEERNTNVVDFPADRRNERLG